MKRVLVFVLSLTAITSLADAQDFEPGTHRTPQHGTGLLLGPGQTYLGPIRSNAYGPGIHADASGRPFQWAPEGIPSTGPHPTLQVKPNAYGLGVHADPYGRIVEPVCPFGQMC